MNALEKLGYVKQPQDEDVDLVEYVKTEGTFKMKISMGIKTELAGKEFQYEEQDWQQDWADKAELKAILELMEEQI